jgi:hypothetical protein
MGREALRRVLGFFIGEVAEDPSDTLQELYAPAAVATGPP